MPDYSDSLLAARNALNRFEHLAALAAAGQPSQLPEATALANKVVIAARGLVAWCERQSWKIPGAQ